MMLCYVVSYDIVHRVGEFLVALAELGAKPNII